MPEMSELARRYEDQGLVLIAVHTVNAGDKMAKYVRDQELEFPVALDDDGKTVEAFKVDSYPDYYLIDRRGVLRVADLKNADVERAVQVLLAEEAPKLDKTARKSGDTATKGD